MLEKNIYIEGGNDKVILFIHGLTGAPSEISFVAKLLQKEGFSSYIPLLIGHGRDIKTLSKTSWQDWYTGLVNELHMLYEKYGRVYIAGLCAGGTLGLLLVKNYPHMVKSLTIYSPILSYNGWNMKFYYPWSSIFLNFLLKILPFLRKKTLKEVYPFGVKNDKIRDIITKINAKNNVVLDSYPLVSLNEYLKLVKIIKKVLGSIKTPLLLIHSIYDEVSKYNSALYIQKKYGGICDLYLLNDSYHLINIDQQKDMVAKQTALFFNHYYK